MYDGTRNRSLASYVRVGAVVVGRHDAIHLIDSVPVAGARPAAGGNLRVCLPDD